MTREERYRAALERIAKRAGADGAGTAPMTQELPVVTVEAQK